MPILAAYLPFLGKQDDRHSVLAVVDSPSQDVERIAKN